MIGAILIFVFLYALIYFFERKRDDLDAFSIATAVVVPTIVVVLIRVGGYFLGLGPWTELLAIVGLIAATYLVLAKNLDIKPSRAAGYTAAVFAFNLLLWIGFVIPSGDA